MEFITSIINSRVTHGVIGACMLILFIEALWRNDNFYEIAWWLVGTFFFISSAIGIIKMNLGGRK